MIDEVASITGLSAGVLRIWELRYRFPNPGRLPNGYRVYSRGLVDILVRIAGLVQDGHAITSIVRDGVLTWPTSAPTRDSVPWTRFDQLPHARGADAISFRVDLDVALRIHDEPAVLLALHKAPICLRPGDRMIAAWLPAYFAAREWQRNGRPFARDLAVVIGRVAGAAVLADVVARWETAEAIG